MILAKLTVVKFVQVLFLCLFLLQAYVNALLFQVFDIDIYRYMSGIPNIVWGICLYGSILACLASGMYRRELERDI
jgi:hypothetical protein